MKRKIINTIIGILVAGVFLTISLRHQPINEVFKILSNVKITYVFFALICYILSFVARSEKWRIQINSLNFTLCSKKSFEAIVLHYFANSFSIKLGAVVRCANMKKNADIPMSTCIGAFFSENIFDFLFLIIALLVSLIINFSAVWTIFHNFGNDFYSNFSLHKWLIIAIFLVIILISAVLMRFYGKMLIEKNKIRLKNFIEAIKKTFKIKQIGMFIFWQTLLWFLLFAMNYFLFKSLLDIKPNIANVLTITSFLYAAWLIPSPGGIGSVQYFMLQAFALYSISASEALSFGFLSNFLTFAISILLGIIVILANKGVNLRFK